MTLGFFVLVYTRYMVWYPTAVSSQESSNCHYVYMSIGYNIPHFYSIPLWRYNERSVMEVKDFCL